MTISFKNYSDGGKAAINEMARTLPRNPTLSHVILSGNNITDEDLQPLILALENLKHAQITTLDLSNNEITSIGVYNLIISINQNHPNLRLFLYNNNISKSELREINELASQTTISVMLEEIKLEAAQPEAATPLGWGSLGIGLTAGALDGSATANNMVAVDVKDFFGMTDIFGNNITSPQISLRGPGNINTSGDKEDVMPVVLPFFEALPALAGAASNTTNLQKGAVAAAPIIIAPIASHNKEFAQPGHFILSEEIHPLAHMYVSSCDKVIFTEIDGNMYESIDGFLKEANPEFKVRIAAVNISPNDAISRGPGEGNHWITYVEYLGEDKKIHAILLNSAGLEFYNQGVDRMEEAVIHCYGSLGMDIEIQKCHLNLQTDYSPSCGLWVLYFVEKLCEMMNNDIGSENIFCILSNMDIPDPTSYIQDRRFEAAVTLQALEEMVEKKPISLRDFDSTTNEFAVTETPLDEQDSESMYDIAEI